MVMTISTPKREDRGSARQVMTRLFEDQLSFFDQIGAPYGGGDFSRELRKIVYLGMAEYTKNAPRKQTAKNA